jgi:hypothetical protein
MGREELAMDNPVTWMMPGFALLVICLAAYVLQGIAQENDYFVRLKRWIRRIR